MTEGRLDLISDSLSPLPPSVKAGALKAFSQLIGGFGLWANAWVRRPVQAVEDKTNARSLVSARLAEAAAAMAVEDPAIVEATLNTLLPKELRKASNRAKVIEAAFEDLTREKFESVEETDEIDEDWLNNFERFCEDASSEKLQKLWGRLLSSEIRKPGSFSKRTLRFLYELDSSTAKKFEKISGLCLDGFVWNILEDGESLAELVALQSAGVVTSVASNLVQERVAFDGRVYFKGSKYSLALLTSAKALDVSLPMLTETGAELLRIVPNPDEAALIKKVAAVLKSAPVRALRHAPLKGAALVKPLGRRSNGATFGEVNVLWGDDPTTSISD